MCVVRKIKWGYTSTDLIGDMQFLLTVSIVKIVKNCRGAVSKVRVIPCGCCKLSRSLLGNITFGEFNEASSLVVSLVSVSELPSLRKDDSWQCTHHVR